MYILQLSSDVKYTVVQVRFYVDTTFPKTPISKKPGIIQKICHNSIKSFQRIPITSG